MLRTSIFVFVIIAIAAGYAPDFIERFSGSEFSSGGKSVSGGHTARASSKRNETARAEPRQSSQGRKIRLKKGRGGHYRADVRVNGRKFQMMVDTGASLIALTARDARRMGVYPDAREFKYETRTANGIARIAVVTLKEVKIGGIRVKNVRASVHRGKGLDTNLLGMSFLNRLRKFNFEGDTLTMVN